MENEEIAKKVDELSERVRRYMAAAEASPANALFLAGVKSALEHISRATHTNTDEIERVLISISEVRAMMGELNACVRAMRNRSFCMAGEEEQRKLEKIIEEENKKKD